MSIVITLAPEIEQQVMEQAAQHNVSIDEYVNATLRDITANTSTQPELGIMSGAEMLAYWDSVGALNRTDMIEDTVEYVQRTRREAEHRDLS